MIHINFNFLSNNVKGIQSSKKCFKQFEYFKSKLKPIGLSYKKRIRPLIARNNWKYEFGGDLHFAHDSFNSSGVLIAFYGPQVITVKKKLSNNKAQVLVLDARIDDFDFLIINIDNANTEKE